MSKCLASVCFWHKADNPTVPAFVRYWTKADKGGFWPAEVCPLLTQSRHRGLLMSGTQTDTLCRFAKHLKYHRG
jgi:hypothetical protein